MNNYNTHELEELTVKFLREHDDYYTSSKRGKVQNTEYPYHTEEQKQRKSKMEVVFSGLTQKDAYKCMSKALDYSLLPIIAN